MANILQVTGPSLNPDNRNISDSQRIAEQGNSQKIQNPVDPSRVVRADGQEEGKSGDATGEKSYSIIDLGRKSYPWLRIILKCLCPWLSAAGGRAWESSETFCTRP